MLEHIINKLGTEEDKLKLTQYKKDFAKYGERHIFECPAEVGKMNEDHTNLFVTLDETFDKCNISHLCVLIHNLQEVLNISDISLQLKHILPGSVLLTFQMPTCLQIEIFPLSSTRKANLAALGIVQLSCGDYQFTLLDEKVKIPEFKIEDLTTQSQQNEDIDNAGTEGNLTSDTYVPNVIT